VTGGAWGLALAAFAWNDRADLRRGVADRHPSPRVRALAGAPGSAPWLLGIGACAAILAATAWTLLGALPGCLAVAVAASGWIYSDPDFFGKGRPVLAPLLHLAGGAANGAAGAAAAGAGGPEIAAWALACGLLFTAAHRVHMVGDREVDLSTGVRTLATRRSAEEAARGAHRSLALAAAVIAVAGLALGRGTGAGLMTLGVLLSVFLVFAGPPDASTPAGWRRFQGRCRVAVVGAALAGVGMAVAMRGGV